MLLSFSNERFHSASAALLLPSSGPVCNIPIKGMTPHSFDIITLFSSFAQRFLITPAAVILEFAEPDSISLSNKGIAPDSDTTAFMMSIFLPFSGPLFRNLIKGEAIPEVDSLLIFEVRNSKAPAAFIFTCSDPDCIILTNAGMPSAFTTSSLFSFCIQRFLSAITAFFLASKDPISNIFTRGEIPPCCATRTLLIPIMESFKSAPVAATLSLSVPDSKS
mmetsp:Transcript_18823/g.26080  ORF Transcript_18823/g.26080 Transcript_18823/m.26080 type:complete len:220 (-) Transcript_18823:17-676(-)